MANPLAVTATQLNGAANGMLLRVFVLTGAAAIAAQAGARATRSTPSGLACDASITTTVTGSVVYGALLKNGVAAFTAAAANVMRDNVSDATNNNQMGTTSESPATGTPGVMTAGASAPSGVTSGGTRGAWAEILADGGGVITEDPSDPNPVSTTSAQVVTSDAFTPPDGALLLALVASNGIVNQLTKVDVQDGFLDWEPLQEIASGSGGRGYAGVWAAQVPPPLSSVNPLITAVQTGQGRVNGMAMRLMVLTGAADISLQSGATASVTSAQQVSITTTVTGSRVYGAAFATATLTPNGSTTVIDDVPDATHFVDYGTMKATAATGSPGAVTLGCTNASGGSAALAEILPDGSGAGIAEDASSLVVSTLTAKAVTATLIPPPGTLIAALISSDGGFGGTNLTTMSVYGGGLAWTELVHANGAGAGYTGVWLAQVPPFRGVVSSGLAAGWAPG